MRRSARIALILILVLAVGLGVLWALAPNVVRSVAQRIANAATGAVEPWIADQLRTLGNDALAGELSFSSLDLELPVTVTLHDVALRENEATVIESARLVVTLTEVPKPGKPIIIESIMIDRPTVHLIERDGRLLGFSPFVAPGPADAPDDADDPPTRLSDHFAFRSLQVTDGTVRWEPETGEPMRLDQLNFTLTGAPSDAPGRYAIDTVIERAPVASIALKGVFDLDNLALHLDDGTVELALDDAQYELLPPSLQRPIREHGIRGAVHAALSGVIPFAEPIDDDAPRAVDIDAHLTLEDGNARFGDWRFPIERFETTVDVIGSALYIDALTVDAFDGTASLDGSVGLTGSVPANLTTRIDGMRLERLLGTMSNDRPKYAGRFVVDVELDGDLAHLDRRLAGGGTVKVTEGRLARMPVIGSLVETVSGVFGGKQTDRANLTLSLAPNTVTLHQIDLISSTVAARGTGTIKLDGALDLKLNAGPMEKVQSTLGALGDILGSITDALVKYHVTGTVEETKVKIRPLGV